MIFSKLNKIIHTFYLIFNRKKNNLFKQNKKIWLIMYLIVLVNNVNGYKMKIYDYFWISFLKKNLKYIITINSERWTTFLNIFITLLVFLSVLSRVQVKKSNTKIKVAIFLLFYCKVRIFFILGQQFFYLYCYNVSYFHWIFGKL